MKQRTWRFFGGKEKNQNHQNGGKASIAGNKAVCQNGNETFSGRIHDSAAGYAYSVAAKAHKHGKSLFAAGLAAGKTAVHIKSSPGQVAEIFQKRKQRKKQSHWGQHDTDNPGSYPVAALNEQLT